MNIKKNLISRLFILGLASSLAFSFASCSDDDNNGEKKKGGAFFLSLTGEKTEYILQAEDINSGEVSLAANNKELELSGYTWIFDKNPYTAIGLIYQQGDPGIGLSYSLAADGTLQKNGDFQIVSRFTSYGFFGDYALTSVGGQTPTDANGNALKDENGNNRTDAVSFNFIDVKGTLSLKTKTITTQNITGNGDQATFSGIVDMGNGEFLTGLVVSQPRDPNATGGSSTGVVTYPDSVWVAAYDANLNLKRIYRDDRLSYSSGRYRSQYYSQIAKADDGSVYVFSGSYESTTERPCGALKISKNATEFDADYYFDIEAKTDGYHFRKVWHITGDYFLLEMYNDLEVTSAGVATQYGIVNVNKNAQTFTWLTGIPAKDKVVSTGIPMPYNGKMYLPITAEDQSPAIYIIDPATAKATKGLTVKGASNINAIGRLAD